MTNQNKRYTKKVRLLALFTLFIFCFSAAGCRNNTATKERIADGRIPVLTIGTTMEVKGINIDDYYFAIMRALLTHMGLVKLDENGDFIGDLAQSWESTDAKTWVFRLKPGITWHDGKEVTAADIKFSLEYLPRYMPVYKSHFKLVEEVNTPDSQTVEIKLSQPNARFLVNLLVLRTLPQHIFADIDDPLTFNDKAATIGCGPYIFDNFDEAAGIITFIANKNYYRGLPNIDEIKFKLFKNPDTMYLALENGDIDLPYFYATGTDPFYASKLAQNTDLKLYEFNNTGIPNALFFNTQKPPVDNARFRQALSYAVDYREMLRLFALGYGSVPNAGFVPQGTPGFTVTRQLEYDPSKAKQILDELGYIDTDNDGLREKEGQTVELTIMVRNDIAENVRIAELLQKYVQAAGVKVNIKMVDNTLFRTISDQEKSHTALLSRTTAWGMMMWAGCGSGYFDARNIGWAGVSDPFFWSVIDKMLISLDDEDYQKAASDYQEYLAQELPAIPLYWNTLIQPYNAKLKGFKVNPMYGVLNEETWFNLRQIKH